jgi:ribulose-5-phosphate 4-epimerase/fuculose-1-phosphate aldolase
MIFGQEKKLREEMIDVGKRLYAMRLAVASSGNLSARLDEKNILVTATGAPLGRLYPEFILKVNLNDKAEIKRKRVTSEFPLHSLIYRNSPYTRVLHCHPPLVNAYFAVHSDIKALTFETKFYVGSVPVVEQETPTVTRPELIIEALKQGNLVVLKNHGVVAVGNTFQEGLALIEALEEAVRTCAVARLFQKNILDSLDKELKEVLYTEKSYNMFSEEHIRAIVDLVNKDEFIARKGSELDLTLQLVIKLDGTAACFRFTFEKGKITALDLEDKAPFVISAPTPVWLAVFRGQLDPFTATTQGKMKLKGEFSRLSRWYAPFSRLFELFTQVRIA